MSGLFLFKKLVIILLVILTGFPSSIFALTEKAQELYKRFHNSVYQIQIIDIDSKEKSTIGSGFQFSREGLIATNYHVISEVVAKPERYRIEFHKENGEKGQLKIKTFDVSHDLAILEGENSNQSYLILGGSSLAKGDHVFPLGNPLDLGMTIIEGTYNGLVGPDQYQHVLLSASLNPGMSGGPALDSKGKVVGVNVAIEGNDLSYLVPVEYLVELVEENFKDDIKKDSKQIIEKQILKKFNHVINKVLQIEWSYERFGHLNIPKNIPRSIFKCWGNSEPEDLEEEQFYSISYKRCESENKIYLSRGFFTGSVGYSIIRLKSDQLNPLKFYKEYSLEFSKSEFYPFAGEKQVADFKCKNNFINLAEQNWKAVYCARSYKEYPKLNDIFLTFALLGKPKQGYVIRIGLSGISQPLAVGFLQHFIGGIQWAE